MMFVGKQGSWILFSATLALLAAGGISNSSAQQIQITGTVKNTQGQPVAGASLSLITQNLFTISDTLGQYAFSGVSMVLRDNRGTFASLFRINAGFLHLALDTREQVDICLYSIDGRKILQVLKGSLSAGEHRVAMDLSTFSSQLRILKIKTGSRACTATISPLGTIAGTINEMVPDNSAELARSAVAGVDSILATAKGYQSTTAPVVNYVGTVNIVLSAAPVWSGNASIDAVFFAQTHVQEDTSKLLRLVGNRETLIKAHVISPNRSSAPQVFAVLDLKGKTFSLELDGPDTLPVSAAKAPGLVQHSYANSFTAIIPKEWIQRGLKITLEAGGTTRVFDSLKIGAPTIMRWRMFDVHFFALSPSDYPAGWLPEFEAKRPVAHIQLQRQPNVIFPELTIPPRAPYKAARIKSKAEYTTLTGSAFDGEQLAALSWNGALKAANGTAGRIRCYYFNIYGAYAGGQAGGYSGVGNGNSVGILQHEMGHAMSLPHWGDNAAYPYKGDMYGIPAPAIYNGTHAGPTWAFDLPSRSFVPCTVQPNSVGGVAGTYKGDPMQGGGVGDQEKGYIMRHFSDYSMNKMQTYLEGHVVVWNDSLKSYASWNDTKGDYSTIVTNNGVQYPLVRDVQVISVMAGVSSNTPQANIVYPPIGPYEAGLITLFDPAVAADRAKADSIFCPDGGCDVCVRVTQGGTVKTFMLPISPCVTADTTAGCSYSVRAINVPASGGTVTKIDLLSTPDAEKNGMPASPAVLYTWQ